MTNEDWRNREVGGVIRFLTIYACLSKIETQIIYKGDNIRRACLPHIKLIYAWMLMNELKVYFESLMNHDDTIMCTFRKVNQIFKQYFEECFLSILLHKYFKTLILYN